MSLTLSIETSTPVCSAALHSEGRLLAHFELHEDQSHASKLALLIDNLLKTTGTSIKDLKAVCVSSGPGSYTGLRIGTSTAKGICYSMSVPLVSCNALEVMCERIRLIATHDALLCPMLDARRMEVYTAMYNSTGDIVMPVQSKIVDEGTFDEWLANNRVVFFGNGAAKCKDIVKNSNAVFVDGLYPEAATLGTLGWKKFAAGQVEDLMTFEPFYLKEFLIKKPTKVLL
jgi:tRNA threonylcarbamoyladenosine biosynthesis protein TsaB